MTKCLVPTPPEEMRPCTTCDIFALASRVINFVLFTLVPAIAVLFYLWAGLMILLAGAHPGWFATGKTIFKNTTWGLVIIFGAWMITNTVLKSLIGDKDVSKNWFRIECTTTIQQPPSAQRFACGSLGCVAKSDGKYTEPTCGGECAAAQKKYSCKDDQCTLDYTGPYTTSDCDDECLAETFYTCDENNQCIEDPEGEYDNPDCDDECQPLVEPLSVTTTSLPDAVVNKSYSARISISGGTTPYTYTFVSGSGTLPPGMLFGNGVFSGTPATAGTYAFTVKVEDSTTPTKQSATKQLSIKVNPAAAVTCPFSGVNLCQGEMPPGGCSNSKCGQYAISINKYASGAATANLLKSILFNESSCNITAAIGSSFGLMQLQSATANIYRSFCGVQVEITSSWLTNPANADRSICIAAQYVNAIAQSRCGSLPRNIYAGYNGGTGANGACGLSTSCAGDKNCAGLPIMRWECLYDNAQYTACNTGYNETRTGVRKVVFCNNNPGF